MRPFPSFVVLLSLTGAGCAMADPGAPGDPQLAALQALEEETGTTWRVRWQRDVHTPAFLEGRTAPMIARHASAEKAARSFLNEHRPLFQIASADDELGSIGLDGDELGMAHVRLVQQQGGVPVWGHELRAHFDVDGSLVQIEGRYAPLPPLDHLAPTVTGDEARTAALAAVAAPSVASARSPSVTAAPALVIDPVLDGSGGAWVGRLAWRVEVGIEDPGRPGRAEVFVDADTREPYRSRDILDLIAGSGTGVFGETETIEVTARSQRFYLEDGSAGRPAQKIYSAGNGDKLPGHLISSRRRDEWDQVPEGAGAAVDAQAYLSATHDYYARVHGRAGALGNGVGMRATVHFGRRYPSAFWNGRQLVFGDGDRMSSAPPSGALDVVAHEFTHAVIESSARLGRDGERGAVNEAIADIFGCFVEHAVRESAANWRVGDELFRNPVGRGGRDLEDPHRSANPAHLSEEVATTEDRGGIHLNSTIVSHAAFLMSEGGTHTVSGIGVRRIGLEAAERIWYRALIRYLGPSSDFSDAADATIAAARDLYGAGSPTTDSVRAAWVAVGVVDGGPTDGSR